MQRQLVVKEKFQEKGHLFHEQDQHLEIFLTFSSCLSAFHIPSYISERFLGSF
jgi:hypothetical protein